MNETSTLVAVLEILSLDGGLVRLELFFYRLEAGIVVGAGQQVGSEVDIGWLVGSCELAV